LAEYRCECTYCGEVWFVLSYSYFSAPKKCLKCGDKNLKVKKRERGNYFGYPEEKENEETTPETNAFLSGD
jgi:hypothetical protein